MWLAITCHNPTRLFTVGCLNLLNHLDFHVQVKNEKYCKAVCAALWSSSFKSMGEKYWGWYWLHLWGHLYFWDVVLICVHSHLLLLLCCTEIWTSWKVAGINRISQPNLLTLILRKPSAISYELSHIWTFCIDMIMIGLFSYTQYQYSDIIVWLILFKVEIT